MMEFISFRFLHDFCVPLLSCFFLVIFLGPGIEVTSSEIQGVNHLVCHNTFLHVSILVLVARIIGNFVLKIVQILQFLTLVGEEIEVLII